VLAKILLYAAVLPSYILNPKTFRLAIYRLTCVNKYYTCGGEYYKCFIWKLLYQKMG